MNFNFGGLGSTLKNGLSTGMDKLKGIGKSGNRIIQPTDLNTGGFKGSTINQNNFNNLNSGSGLENVNLGYSLNPNLDTGGFSGSVIQQPDLDNPQQLTFKDKIMSKWNSIPQEKKSAFAQQMSEKSEDDTQTAPITLPQMQDYSWALQPTMRMGQQYYGN